MEEEDHRDDESIDGDEEVDGNSKNRVSKSYGTGELWLNQDITSILFPRIPARTHVPTHTRRFFSSATPLDRYGSC
jgi:hypothetical protein